MAGKSIVTLLAVGDIVAFRQKPESAFEYVGSTLREADIKFAQNERHYSDRKELSFVTDSSKKGPEAGFTELTTASNAEALKLGGFDVISFASNHSMDLGPSVMMETVDVLKKLGFAVIGVGRNIQEARKPVIIERKGVRVAFLAYTSVPRPLCHAGPEKAGVAPMRAYTLYNQLDYQPGTPSQILTFPYKEDLAAVIEDVRKVRSKADVVAISFHWGIHFVHAAIATYQKEVAHAVIDAGADIILGHHPHLPKGIEVYKGKPIFYSMGNFVLDMQYDVFNEMKNNLPPGHTELYNWKADPEWTMYAFPPESRKSMIVRCNIVDKKIQRVCFLPVMINQRAQPRIVPRDDKAFDEIVEYMKEISESQGFETTFSIEGNDVVVSLV